MTRPDPYRLLGLEPDASIEEVRAAFREKVREKHPDTGHIDETGPDVQEIIEAYRSLSDAELRRRHRSTGHERESGLEGRRIRVRQTGRADARSAATTGACLTCGGSGRLREEKTCPECRGRAHITALDGDHGRVINCRRCTGTGTIVLSRTCPTCSVV